MLTATLKLAPASSKNVQEYDPDPNELTNYSNDSDKTIVNNGNFNSSTPEEDSNL